MRRSASPTLESGRGLLHPVAQLHEGLLQRGGVPDDVLLLAPQHGALGRPQAAQLDGQDDAEDEGQKRNGRRPERDEALRGGQVIHVG